MVGRNLGVMFVGELGNKKMQIFAKKNFSAENFQDREKSSGKTSLYNNNKHIRHTYFLSQHIFI